MSGRLRAALLATINNAGGLTLREAAESSGVSFNTLARMRRGDYAPPSVVVFLRACEWAGVDPFKALDYPAPASPESTEATRGRGDSS